MRNRPPLLALAVAVVCVRLAGAHERPSHPVDGANENLTVTLPLRRDTAPTIDGTLGEGEWDGAVRLGSFRRCWTFRGTLGMVQTTVYLMGAEGRLYVAWRCEISDPSKLQASETTRSWTCQASICSVPREVFRLSLRSRQAHPNTLDLYHPITSAEVYDGPSLKGNNKGWP